VLGCVSRVSYFFSFGVSQDLFLFAGAREVCETQQQVFPETFPYSVRKAISFASPLFDYSPPEGWNPGLLLFPEFLTLPPFLFRSLQSRCKRFWPPLPSGRGYLGIDLYSKALPLKRPRLPHRRA